MVTVTNKKTGKEHVFDNESWEVAKSKGLHTRYNVLAQSDSSVAKKATYTPPELNKVADEGKEEKPKVKKPKDKDKPAG